VGSNASFERFCLTAGIATLAAMMEEDASRLCGPRYGRAEGKAGHRWGTTKGKVGFHGGKVEIDGVVIKEVCGKLLMP
jgi:putative transposase